MTLATTSTEHRILPNRGELPDFLLTTVRRLCIEQGFVFERRGKHKRLYAPDGQWVTLPTTLFDGPVRYKYEANLRRIGADLTFPKRETVRPSGDAPAMTVEQVESPWSDAEWRAMQRQSDVWWRRELAGDPPPELVARAATLPQVSAYARDLLARLDEHVDPEPRKDAQGKPGWSLAAARQMLRDGYALSHVTRATGWGRMWLEDLAQRIGQGG